MRPALLTALIATAIVTGLPVAAPAGSKQGVYPTVLAQMMHGEKGMQGQGQGMQGQGMQGHGTQGQGTQGQGMQGHGGTGPGVPGQMGGMGPGMMMGPANPMMQMMMQGRMGGMSNYVEGRIAFLHAELKITEAQMPAWHEFANVLRANAKRVADARAAQPHQLGPSFIDRLDDQERWMSVGLESVRALKPAYAKLYGTLDDKQKKTADEILSMSMLMR